jgi:hypothetical protein
MRPVFTPQELESLAGQFFFELGFKVTIYHSELHRGIIVTKDGAPLHPMNVVKAFNY